MISEAQVRSWFEAAGVTIATATESETERLARIAGQINSGTRSVEEVQAAIQGIAAGTVTFSPEASAYYGGGTEIGQLDLFNVAGGAEVWNRSDGTRWLAYMVPDTDSDPLWMVWEITSDADFQSYFGPGQATAVNRYVSMDEWHGLSVEFGDANEIDNTSGNPFATFENDMARLAVLQPWILEADYTALSAMAVLEGRQLTQDEIATTNWFQTNSQGQREWMMLLHGDPATAERVIAEAHLLVEEQIRLAGGGRNVSDMVIDFLAMNLVQGNISQTELSLQIRGLVDPYSGVELMPGLAELASTGGVTATVNREDEVRSLLHTWLGPHFGSWTDDEIARIAGDFRNDPNARTQFVESLKDQRMVLLPEYQDRDISYQAIANTWKQWWMGQWGQAPDENSDLWLKVLRNNDTDISGQLLRREGLNQGVGKVVDAVNSASLERSIGLVRSPV